MRAGCARAREDAFVGGSQYSALAGAASACEAAFTFQVLCGERGAHRLQHASA